MLTIMGWAKVVIAAWLMCCSSSSLAGLINLQLPILGLTIYLGPPTTSQDVYLYNTIYFNIQGTTPDSYQNFIASIRGSVSSGSTSHGITVLRDPSTVGVQDRFLLIAITSSTTQRVVTVAIDVTTVAIVGFLDGNRNAAYLLKTDAPVDGLFTSKYRYKLPFSSSPAEMETYSGSSRANIALGLNEMDKAINDLTKFLDDKDAARALLVVSQMITNAARNRYIEHKVRATIGTAYYGNFLPTPDVISFENNWQTFSFAIQDANQRAFYTPVQLKRPDNGVLLVESITPLVTFSLVLIQFAASPGTSEPNMRIRGRNDFCLKGDSVSKVVYVEKCSWLLNNEIWSLKRDGTVQIGGLCLTSNKYNIAGKTVVLDLCDGSPNTKWEVLDDGTIKNPSTELVLSATGEGRESPVTTENQQKEIASSYSYQQQAWLPYNSAYQWVMYIIGMDRCLQKNPDGKLVFRTCEIKGEQQWRSFPDGSIRYHPDTNLCITSPAKEGENIYLAPYDGSARQRWFFQNDGIIRSELNGLTLDIAFGQPDADKTIVWPAHADYNQQFFPELA